jgi:hypothetical protein
LLDSLAVSIGPNDDDPEQRMQNEVAKKRVNEVREGTRNIESPFAAFSMLVDGGFPPHIRRTRVTAQLDAEGI